MREAARRLLKCELRGEKKLFLLAAATVAAAAAALTLTLSLADAFQHSFDRSAKFLLGGDVALRLSQRDFTDEEKTWLRRRAHRLSFVRTARMLAVAGERAQLARLKAVDRHYPLYGEVKLKSGRELAQLFAPQNAPGGAPPAAVGKELLLLLDVAVGDIIVVGGATVRIADVVLSEPDPDPRLWASAPLVLADFSMLADSLKRPGILMERHLRLRLRDGQSPAEWRRALDAAFPDGGWRVQTPEDALSNLRRLVGELRNFLTLVSMAAMLMAGIGVGGGVSAFLRGRIRAIAVVKMLGGDSRLTLRVYCLLVSLFSLAGAGAGVVIGGALYFFAAPRLSVYLPSTLSLSGHWSWGAVATAAFVALWMSAVFAAPPLLRFARMNPLLLFNAGGREDDPPPLTVAEKFLVAAMAAIAISAIPLPPAGKIVAVLFVPAAGAIYAVSMLFAAAAEKIAARCPPPWSWGFLAVSRNRRQAAAGAVSLGVGLSLFAAVSNLEKNFSRRIDDTLKRDAPALYLTAIRDDQLALLSEVLRQTSPSARMTATPFLRGRITHLGGRKSADIEVSREFQWILRGDRGLTWTADIDGIGGSVLSQGKLWDDSVPHPQVSFAAEAAAAFGLNLGDDLRLNILGRNLTATITSFRRVDWQSFDINFVIILSGRPFGNAPFSHLGAVFLPPEDAAAMQLAIGKQFPNITPIATAAIFDAAKRLLSNAAALLKTAVWFLLLGALPMTVAAMMESQRRRQKDAVLLRLLGASRREAILVSLTEFFTLAAMAVIPAAATSLLAGWTITEYVFDFSLNWRPHLGLFLWQAAAVTAVFLSLGAIAAAHCVRQPPLPLLRND